MKVTTAIIAGSIVAVIILALGIAINSAIAAAIIALLGFFGVGIELSLQSAIVGGLLITLFNIAFKGNSEK